MAVKGWLLDKSAALAQPNVSVLEMSDAWSEQDERDLSTFSLRYAATLYPEGEEPE